MRKRYWRPKLRNKDIRAIVREATISEFNEGFRAMMAGYKARVCIKTADGWKRISK